MLSWFKKSNKPEFPNAYDTLVSENAKIDKHEFLFHQGLHINGEIKLNIRSTTPSSVITVGRSGKVEGSMKADFVLVNGLVVGDISAAETVEMVKYGKVIGNVYCKNFEGDRTKVSGGKIIER